MAILGLLFFFWPKAPASIQLTTVPSDPLVLLDNQPVSSISSPFIITGVSPDKPHTLEVRKTGYQPWSTTLTINAGQALQLPPVNLEPIGATVPQATATGFFLDTEPSGAQVYVDGQLQKERTPVRITNLKPGNHTIQAEDPGTHQRWETELVLVSGQMVSLPRVRLNAAQVTTSSASPTAREETAQADHPPRQKRARATSEPDVAAPSEGSGTLQINSTPWSQIFINGDLVGNTPQMSLSLPAGTHQVRLVNPEFNLEKTLTVKIRANKTTKKILSLQGSGQ